MKRSILLIMFTMGIWGFGKAQMTIEEQVADTACACLSKLDTNQIKSNANVVKMACLQEAIAKNDEAIKENYKTEMRKEADQEKIGIGGSMLIKVQNVLTKSCPVYARFEKKMQTQRQGGRGRQ